MRKFLNRLNLWRRLGVVMTVIWLAAVPPLFWFSEQDGLDYHASNRLESCLDRVVGLPVDADRIRSNIRSMAAQGATLLEVDNYVIAQGLIPETVANAFQGLKLCEKAASKEAALNPGTSYPVMFGWCALFAASVWALLLSASFAARWVWAGRLGVS